MQIVDRAMQYPAHCMWTFKTDAEDAGPWLDLGRDFDERHDGRMYLRVVVAQEIGAQVGMVRPEAHQELAEELAAAKEREAALQEQVVELEEFKQAVYVMKSEGFKAGKKPGRPATKKETAGAH